MDKINNITSGDGLYDCATDLASAACQCEQSGSQRGSPTFQACTASLVAKEADQVVTEADASAANDDVTASKLTDGKLAELDQSVGEASEESQKASMAMLNSIASSAVSGLQSRGSASVGNSLGPPSVGAFNCTNRMVSGGWVTNCTGPTGPFSGSYINGTTTYNNVGGQTITYPAPH